MNGREIRMVRLREHAREAVASWPPFTPRQMADLGAIITPSLRPPAVAPEPMPEAASTGSMQPDACDGT